MSTFKILQDVPTTTFFVDLEGISTASTSPKIDVAGIHKFYLENGSKSSSQRLSILKRRLVALKAHAVGPRRN